MAHQANRTAPRTPRVVQRGLTEAEVIGGPSDSTALANDFFSHMIALEPSLSRSHRVIARAILTRPKEFIEKPIEELAPWLGVSAPTITRFSRVAGCEGLRHLKLKIMGGLRVGLRYLEPLTLPRNVGEVIERIMLRAQHAMAAAAQTIDFRTVERAAEIIANARTLYVFGSGGVSSWLIDELQNRLFRLGVHVTPCADHQMQMMLAATVQPTDVVLCCSLTGRNVELVKAATIAAQYGATTIALTTRDSPLAAATDCALTMALRDDGDVLTPTTMRYGFLVAIDVLSMTVGLRSSGSAQQILRRIKQQFVTHRDEDDQQPLCD